MGSMPLMMPRPPLQAANPSPTHRARAHAHRTCFLTNLATILRELRRSFSTFMPRLLRSAFCSFKISLQQQAQLIGQCQAGPGYVSRLSCTHAAVKAMPDCTIASGQPEILVPDPLLQPDPRLLTFVAVQHQPACHGPQQI